MASLIGKNKSVENEAYSTVFKAVFVQPNQFEIKECEEIDPVSPDVSYYNELNFEQMCLEVSRKYPLQEDAYCLLLQHCNKLTDSVMTGEVKPLRFPAMEMPYIRDNRLSLEMLPWFYAAKRLRTVVDLFGHQVASTDSVIRNSLMRCNPDHQPVLDNLIRYFGQNQIAAQIMLYHVIFIVLRTACRRYIYAALSYYTPTFQTARKTGDSFEHAYCKASDELTNAWVAASLVALAFKMSDCQVMLPHLPAPMTFPLLGMAKNLTSRNKRKSPTLSECSEEPRVKTPKRKGRPPGPSRRRTAPQRERVPMIGQPPIQSPPIMQASSPSFKGPNDMFLNISDFLAGNFQFSHGGEIFEPVQQERCSVEARNSQFPEDPKIESPTELKVFHDALRELETILPPVEPLMPINISDTVTLNSVPTTYADVKDSDSESVEWITTHLYRCTA